MSQTAFDAEMRPRPSKRGLKTKSNLEYNNTTCRKKCLSYKLLLEDP